MNFTAKMFTLSRLVLFTFKISFSIEFRVVRSCVISSPAKKMWEKRNISKVHWFTCVSKLILLKHSTINTLYPIVSLIYFSAIFNFSIKNSNKAKACERNSFQKDLQNILLSVWINFKFFSAHSSSPIRCFCKNLYILIKTKNNTNNNEKRCNRQPNDNACSQCSTKK